MNKEELYEKIIQILKSKGARKIAIFGSYVRGKNQKVI